MIEPLVSIIIPCFNYADFLNQTLHDLIKQQHQHWECVIIDDGSTDDTKTVAKHYVEKDRRFQYHYQSNTGLSSARNNGIMKSKGDYFQFLDSDDFIQPLKLARQVELLEQNMEVDIVYGKSLFFFDDDPTKLFPGRNRRYSAYQEGLRVSGKGKVILNQLLKDNIMEVSTCLLRKSVIERTGLFDEHFKTYEDWQYWIRCANNGIQFYYFPEEGTETLIRCGHNSMMQNRRSLAEHGIMVRKYMHAELSRTQRLYNLYRMAKLRARLAFKIY